MLMRKTDNVYDLAFNDAFDLEKHVHALTHAISNGNDQTNILDLARKALCAAQNANMCISEQKKKITVLDRDCVTDSLTEILNRRGFEKEMHRSLVLARRNNTHGALIYIDLDDFKSVNDTYGHAAGDAVLRKVAKVLKEHVRETDIIARIGGDEFVVLLNDTSLINAHHRQCALLWSLNHTSIIWQGCSIAVQASMGTEAFEPSNCESDIMQHADAAMYAMKSHKSTTMQYA